MSDRQLLRIQAISGSVFLAFTLVHLANTGIASLGLEAYDGFQSVARLAYQNPLVEVGLLLVPLAVHSGAAIVRLRRDGFRRRNTRLRARLHRGTGYFLLLFIWGHVAATRGPSILAGVDLGFAGVSYTFAWLPVWFYPYYTTLALCGLYHGVNGALLAASIFGLRVPEALRYGPGFWVPWLAAAAGIVIGIAALGGNLFAIPDPMSGEYARFMTELTGGGAP